LPPQRFVTFKDTLGAPKITVDFYVEAACVPPPTTIFNPGTGQVQTFPNCECIQKQDNRFQRVHDAECHDGFEHDAPYCYVDDACQHPNAVWGTDTTSGFTSNTGNRILVCDNTECKASQDAYGQPNRKQFKLGVRTPSSEFNCFVDTPLTAGEWNHILFEFSNTEFYTSANGRFHQRAFLTSGYEVGSNTAGAVQNVFQIGEWEIGADAGGLIGTLDHVKLSIGEPTGGVSANIAGNSSGGGSDGGAIAAGVIVPLLLIILIGVVCWYYWDEIMDRMGKSDNHSNPPISIQAPIAKNLSNPQTRKTGMSFDYSRSEQNVEWYYVENDQQVGPFTDAIFMSRIGTQVQKDTLVWNGTTVEDWIAAGEVPELNSKFETAAGSRRPNRPAAAARGSPPSKRSATADTLWNYVGPDGSNIGPITETQLLEMNLPGETYVWNGTTVNNWTYLQDTYLAGLQV